MFQPGRDGPWKFSDGSFLESFRHEDILLDVFYDGHDVYAFGFMWPITDPPSRTNMVSWHRDHGLTSQIAIPGGDPDLGHIEAQPRSDYTDLIELVDREGAALPVHFREAIVGALRQTI